MRDLFRILSVVFVSAAVVVVAAAAWSAVVTSSRADVAQEVVELEHECSLPELPDTVSDPSRVLFPFRVPSDTDDRRGIAADCAERTGLRVPLRPPHAALVLEPAAILRSPTQVALCCFRL